MVVKYAALKARKEAGSNIVQRWLRIADMASDNTPIFVTDQQAKMFSTISHLLMTALSIPVRRAGINT